MSDAQVFAPAPPPPPVERDSLRYGDVVPAGHGSGTCTVVADMDFETYSEAGYKWDPESNKWVAPDYVSKTAKKGLSIVGARLYAQHPSTEVLVLWYDLKDGAGRKAWIPSMPLPQDLFDHIAAGKMIEAFNMPFEEAIWNETCVRKYGFPVLPDRVLTCAANKARAFCLPGSLEKAAQALHLDEQKDKEGARLLRKFSMPRNPTKKDPRTRIHPLSDPDGPKLYAYGEQDIVTEFELSLKIPDVSPLEREYWLMDLDCNRAGVKLDRPAVEKAVEYLQKIYAESEEELYQLTGGKVSAATEVKNITEWLKEYHGVKAKSLDEDGVNELLGLELAEDARRVLEIRRDVASASVRKYFTMMAKMGDGDRVYELFIVNSARTGRDAGRGIQVQNLPNDGPDVRNCSGCPSYFDPRKHECPACGTDASFSPIEEWDYDAMDHCIERLKQGTLDLFFPRVIEVLAGCLRGMIIADEEHDFICSDYSSIEAVVQACLTGVQWRIDTFRQQKCIYLASASKITGTPVEEYERYKEENGKHHPDRKLGKVAELASGFGGWIGSWLNFGASSFLSTEHEIKQKILAWRKASPEIEEAWGGQIRGFGYKVKQELYGLEGLFIQAFLNPGKRFHWREGVSYIRRGNTVFCELPSGRTIPYHDVVLEPSARRAGTWTITFMGYNTNPQMGKIGWVRLDTYGGRLFENVVQAVARDIMAYAAVNLHAAGYRIRLRVHDELVALVPKGWGSVEEFERIGAMLPEWAQDWPIRMSGGWRGKRFRK